MRIAFAGQKGGSGKSTCSIATASEWHLRGKSVLLVDADSQGTAMTWGDVANEEKIDAPTVVAMGEGLHRQGQFPKLSTQFDISVIDCPGRNGKVQRSALMVSDVVVIPCGPSAADAWALAESAEMVQEAQTVRPDLKAFILLTKVQSRTTLAKEAMDSLAEVGIPILDTRLHFRVAYQEALSSGRGVTDYAPSSSAANEVRALVDELERATKRRKKRGH